MIALGRHGSKAIGLAVLVLTQAERISTPESNEDQHAAARLSIARISSVKT